MIDFDQVKTIADIVRVQNATSGDCVAQIFEGRTTTYSQLHDASSRVAQGLLAQGCKPDTRIAFMGKSSDVYFELLYGSAKARNVIVGVNWRLAAPEVAYVINDAQCEVIFVGKEFYDIIQQVLPDCPTVKRVIALDGGHGDWTGFDEWRDGFPADDPHMPIAGDDDVIQLYTSGTTGHPKGVQLTNNNYISIFEQGVKGDGWANWSSSDVNLVCMPLFHVAGVNVGVIGHAHGTKNIIIRDVDPALILSLVAEHKINIAFMVPAVIMFLMQQPNIKDADLSSLRQVLYGASPISEALLVQAQERFKCDFMQVYGLTETAGGGTMLSAADHAPGRGKLRSCGKPGFGLEVRIVGDDNQDVPQGEVGEILIRGGSVMKGYWNRPEATAEAIDKDGWFRTGDAGFMDEEDYIFIHDRVKDMIVTGGENVYPAEVENALFAHEAVADVAVIGIPDERWGEAVKAIVVLQPGVEAPAADIIAWVKTRIAGFKVPKSIDFIDALPRNPSGKILRRELRDPYWAGQDRRVG